MLTYNKASRIKKVRMKARHIDFWRLFRSIDTGYYFYRNRMHTHRKHFIEHVCYKYPMAYKNAISIFNLRIGLVKRITYTVILVHPDCKSYSVRIFSGLYFIWLEIY